MIIVGSEDDTVYALQASDGTERWRYRTRSRIEWGPKLENGIVYAASADGSLFALDARLGRLLWRTNLGGQIGPRGEAGTIA